MLTNSALRGGMIFLLSVIFKIQHIAIRSKMIIYILILIYTFLFYFDES